MNTNIENLEPKQIWINFKKLCSVPHPSHHEEKIRELVVNFCKEIGLNPLLDEVGNIIVSKPATPGMENHKGVILQAHLDMVPQANSDSNHNFETDPIKAYIDGEWVTADGTTLGADNGIGAAAAMAILESKDIAHGPLECLFTATEETGMDGAFGLKAGLLQGSTLLNLDTEDEGELIVGCAGGLDVVIAHQYQPTQATGEAFKIELKGLKGGHSGLDINLGRANANKVMARLLQKCLPIGVKISSFEGGNLRNAIPREATSMVVVPSEKINEWKDLVKLFTETIKAEFSVTEDNISISVLPATLAPVMNDEEAEKFVDIVRALPNGVMRMSDSIPGLVETSTNLAIVNAKNGSIGMSCLLRSSVESAKYSLATMMLSVCKLAKYDYKDEGGYPGWKPNLKSPVLNTMINVYEKNYGKKPEIKAVHAGLECGLFSTVYPHWDMVSFGPTIRHPHSPDEKIKIDTVGMFWDYLQKTLAAI
ncbi:aminoacyl-histidine dipeptidase [Bacteroidia bacterium]|nr:aminoacyl-histidine dipeptidase [Bacteroidia bacterium]